ncbi:MAG: M48 family metalloprotease [Acidobacteriota bacterium]|nr:M48 family metalloprotease [Acidobacteriota bacterium]
MRKAAPRVLSRYLTALTMVWALLAILPLAGYGQTRISMPRNKYKVEDDVRLGRDAARQVEQQMPILNDAEATRYVQAVGQRLVNALPPEFQQPQFQYSFQIVNARDINAFALPGGPMYVNRGMIEAARNEGEMAGVMAHEIAHVALRHATAQATKQSNPLNKILGIGAVLGGAILGGQTGAVLGQQIYRGVFVNPYSRDYETQADILGAHIMARAGYDPRDLANIFQTIAQQSGGSRGPEWLSTHPDPGNRFNTINREASLLRVSPEPIKMTQGFMNTKRRFQGMPRAQTMEEIARNPQNNRGGQQTTINGRYDNRVQTPSSRYRTYSSGNQISISVPENWETVSESETSVWFSPEGAYGNEGITHGAMIGIAQTQSANLSQGTQEYVEGLLQSNNYLRQQSNYSRAVIAGRSGLATVLAGRSPVTNRNEIVTVYTTTLRNGYLFYVITVVPQNEAASYDYAFRNMLRSLRLGV